jgi:hypothetical protein
MSPDPNSITYHKASEAAFSEATELLPQCRFQPWIIRYLLEFLASRDAQNIPFEAALRFALATEEASFHLVMQEVTHAHNDVREIISKLDPQTNDEIFWKHTPNCANRPKLNHADLGTKNALLTLGHRFSDLANALGNSDEQAIFDGSDSLPHYGTFGTSFEAYILQAYFDELHYTVAEATARNANEVIKALGAVQNHATVVRRFRSWGKAMLAGKEQRPFLARTSKRYDLTS